MLNMRGMRGKSEKIMIENTGFLFLSKVQWKSILLK
jgi:hypothetical protein